MFLKLLKYFQENPYLINGISPEDIEKFLKIEFNKKGELSLEEISLDEKKQACLLIDLLRFLVLDSKIKFRQQEIVFFDSILPSLDENSFFQAIEKYTEENKGFLAFVYNKLKNKERSIQILKQFDEKIIKDYLKKY